MLTYGQPDLLHGRLLGQLGAPIALVVAVGNKSSLLATRTMFIAVLVAVLAAALADFGDKEGQQHIMQQKKVWDAAAVAALPFCTFKPGGIVPCRPPPTTFAPTYAPTTHRTYMTIKRSRHKRDLQSSSLGTAILVEPRHHPLLPSIILNIWENLPQKWI